MKFEVRSDVGSLLGHMDIDDVSLLLRGPVRFAFAKDARYYGTGFRLLPDDAVDMSFRLIDLRVGTWVEPPMIGEHGTYRPGRCDYVLYHDGPVEILRSVRQFTALDEVALCGEGPTGAPR